MRNPFAGLRLSISTRLTLWYGVSLFILLSLFVLFLYTSLHVSLHHDFDEQLRYDEARLREAVRVEGATPVLLEDEALRAVAYRTEGPAGTYVRLLSPSGEVLFQSPNFRGRLPLPSALPEAVAPVDVSRAWQRAPARSRYAPLVADQGRLLGWLEVTRLESSLHNELHRLRWLLTLGILLGTAVAIASGYGLARRALHPVATITTAARQVQAAALGRRIPTDFGVQDELTDLAETLNDLLARLDASFERERRFRADAAHEMFTPISAIQSEIDVALLRPREPVYYQQTLATLRDHVGRLAALVEDLLVLSRAEAGGPQGAPTANVSEGAQRLLQRLRAVADARRIRLLGDLAPSVLVAVDPAHLDALLENLLDNAIKYTPEGGRIDVQLTHADGEAVLRVTDTGVGFAPEEADRLFDRFYRSDAAEVQAERGSGLGLAIVKAIVEGYGGGVSARSDGPDRGATFEARLPCLYDGG